jgi:hypothetical protein
MQIEEYSRRLRSAQNAAKAQNKIAQDLAMKVADVLKARVKQEGTKITDVATRSGIPFTALINWVWGGQTHNLPHAEVLKIWRAAKARPGQKVDYSKQLRRLPLEAWQETNKVLACRIGCSRNHVGVIRRQLGLSEFPKRGKVK